jgi:hypothetical protein
LLPSSESKDNPRKKPAEIGAKLPPASADFLLGLLFTLKMEAVSSKHHRHGCKDLKSHKRI